MEIQRNFTYIGSFITCSTESTQTGRRLLVAFATRTCIGRTARPIQASRRWTFSASTPFITKWSWSSTCFRSSSPAWSRAVTKKTFPAPRWTRWWSGRATFTSSSNGARTARPKSTSKSLASDSLPCAAKTSPKWWTFTAKNCDFSGCRSSRVYITSKRRRAKKFANSKSGSFNSAAPKSTKSSHQQKIPKWRRSSGHVTTGKRADIGKPAGTIYHQFLYHELLRVIDNSIIRFKYRLIGNWFLW